MNKKGLSLLSGKARFLPPKSWERWHLPFKVEVEGGVTIVSALQREGVISGVIRTTGGMIRLDVFNSTDEVVRITPTTQLVSIGGYSDYEIVRLVAVSSVDASGNEEDEISAESLAKEIQEKFAVVGDLSEHPVLEPMEALGVRAEEVDWSLPATQGMRTPFKTETGACRHKVAEQLEQYLKRGYLRKVSNRERVFLSPLLPIEKRDGTYRFTNDFRLLNAYFKRSGQAQVDVWRRLWDIDPTWKYYAKIDLKDGFFGIPVDKDLQRAFAFSWQDRRYAWKRIPQGWTWSPILFAERIAEIVQGLGTVQFVDDLLVGSTSKRGLRMKLLAVFSRLKHFGLKVNLNKTEFLTTQVTFLGIEISHGEWSLTKYYQKKMNQLGAMNHWKDLERFIGILSYARKTIVGLEGLLAPIRQKYLVARKEVQSKDFWEEVRSDVDHCVKIALDRQLFLRLPGVKTNKYVLETDWSGEHAGYMLFAATDNGLELVDLGSCKLYDSTSSFLGELKAVKWACVATKAFRGSTPLLIRTDNQSVAEGLQNHGCCFADKRALRIVGWIVGNEDFTVEFLPGVLNMGADLLSRPRKLRKPIKKPKLLSNSTQVNMILDSTKQREIAKAHAGHWNPYKTLQNLKMVYPDLWDGAEEDVREFIRKCDKCRLHGRPIKYPGWRPMIAHDPNAIVFWDFMGPLSWPDQEEPVYILVGVDAMTRFIQLRLCGGPSAEAVKAGLENWIRELGTPKQMVSDQGPAFMSHDALDLCARYDIQVVRTPAYAPWSNGMVERVVGTVLERIKREGPELPWPAMVRKIARDYNNCWHEGIKMTPISLMLRLDHRGRRINEEHWLDLCDQARYNTKQAQLRRSRRAQKARIPRRKPQVGDKVLLKNERRTSKLDEEWIPGFEIDEVRGNVLYLKNPDGEVQGPIHVHQTRLDPFFSNES